MGGKREDRRVNACRVDVVCVWCACRVSGWVENRKIGVYMREKCCLRIHGVQNDIQCSHCIYLVIENVYWEWKA